MATTIQISNTTKQILDFLKEKQYSDSYNAVLQNILKKHVKVSKSMFGSVKGIKWKKDDRANI